MTCPVGLRVLAQRDGMGSDVGGGDPAATPAAPAADGRTNRQQDAAAEITEMLAKIKFECCLDPWLAEAAALHSANEMMGISPRGTLTEQAKLLLDTMGLALPSSSQQKPGPERAAPGPSTTPRGRVLPAWSQQKPGPKRAGPGPSTTPRERVDAAPGTSTTQRECVDAAPGTSTTQRECVDASTSAAAHTTRCDIVVGGWVVGGGWRVVGDGC